MKDFTDKLAVVTGGASGIGRELVRQLAAEGCNVAFCDISERVMAETLEIIETDQPPHGVRVTGHLADVSDEAQLVRFRDEVKLQHNTDKLHLLINNAGVGGGGSMIADDRVEWERTFNICWGGVYLGVRTFLPMLQPADEAHIVNVSSAVALWASRGRPQTAYATAKFAVRGFTEALITDLRANAPHIKCSVAMPGHVGTSIYGNTLKVLNGQDEDDFSPEFAEQKRRFEEEAPTSASEAAKIILDGVMEQRWRILVGEDATLVDEMVRADPNGAYEPCFFENVAEALGRQRGS